MTLKEYPNKHFLYKTSAINHISNTKLGNKHLTNGTTRIMLTRSSNLSKQKKKIFNLLKYMSSVSIKILVISFIWENYFSLSFYTVNNTLTLNKKLKKNVN